MSQLDTFFNPRSIVLVGASERSTWSNTTRQSLTDFDYPGQVCYVNRKGADVYGSQAATRIADIGVPIDLALLMVPASALAESLDDMHAAGVRSGVVLASGFAETGAAGREAQGALLAQARRLGITLLGPNCVGFINYAARVPAFTVTPPKPVLPGNLAIVAQSGAVGNLASQFAHRQNIGLSCLVTTGNEADLDSGRVIDYLVDDPATKAIAVFLETVRDTKAFTAAARRALQAGKPIVALKIGSSPTTARTAQAHTGALVGDDRVFDAVCRNLGIVRVRSIEEMVITAEIISRIGVVKKDGVALASISGGICEIMGDEAAAAGIALPDFDTATVAQLKSTLPDYGATHNPLDVTGAFIQEPALMGRTVKILTEDPGVGVLGIAFDVPISEQETRAYSLPSLQSIQSAIRDAKVPTLIISHTSQSLTEHARRTVDELGLDYLPCGVQVALPALGRSLAWSRWQKASRDRVATKPVLHASPTVRLTSERALLQFLASCDVPVVRQDLARSDDEAVAAARGIGGMVVLKIASDDIAHKTEVGGVALNLEGDAAVAAAFRRIIASAKDKAPAARVDGVVVAPMREQGVELFVGVHVDPQWGPVLAVGLGGVWVEVLKDSQLHTLPVNEADVLDMLAALKGGALLDGFRGQPAVSRQAIARAVVAITDAAMALGPDLQTLEINPLLATASRAEALDALAVWADPA